MSYLIVRDDKPKILSAFCYGNFGYEFNPVHRNDSYLRVSKINVLNTQMIDHILSIKFNSLFKKIYYHVITVAGNEDSSEADAVLVLDEVARLKSIVLNKYDRFLSKEKQILLLKKVQLLENEAKVKALMIRSLNPVDEETLGKSR